ncbi:uncharacterized protein LOC135210758 [Macrobrachium nipponense]|uniref:uncharacterized protein LOC135210758 n=1 Tax=Macrobrachium nipponense TaxID=159736 RepID=UPI0030C7EFA6
MLAGCGIITSLSLMLIACPAVASESQPPAGRCQIERIDILEVRPHQSTFRFKPFYNLDYDTCHGKVKWKFVMKDCNSSEPDAVEHSCTGDKEDICKVDMEGSYKVALNETTIISDCFTLPGLLVVPRAALVLRDSHVELDLKPDIRVQSWNLTAYKAFANRDEVNPECSSDRLTEIQIPLFEEPFIERNSFSFPYEFSLDQCYCFKIRPNGYDTELTFPRGVIKSLCRPVRTNSLPPTPPTPENHTLVIVCVVVIVAILLVPLMVCVIIIQLRKRRRMIPGLPQEGQNLIEVPRDVLVIYARQESHSRRVCELVRSLQSAGKSKIHDIHANTDDGKHADPNEWLRQRIMKDRILILLSPALRKHLEVVFSLKRSLIAEEIGYTEDGLGMNPALVHALRILVGQNDYSKIFIASFSSERFEEEAGDFSEILTRERRYTLPEHLEELKVDMMLVREKEVSV